MSRYAKITFFLLLTTIPIQLGKHFWPYFSFVQGIRIDYLSPTIYLSDILFIILFVLSISKLKRRFFRLFSSHIGIVLLLTFLIGSAFSVNPAASLYGVIKFMEFVYIGFFIALEFNKKDITPTLFVLTLGGLVEVVISIFQFLSQSSLGGVFYYLGERTFNASTPGIAAFQFENGLLLRPYGTFPHPNVLSFYLLFSFSFILYVFTTKDLFSKFIKIAILALLTIGILITFSRVTIILTIFIYLFYFYKRLSKSYSALFGASVLSVILFLFQRFFSSLTTDLDLRFQLIKIAFEIFIKNPLFGVGINNFFNSEIMFQKTVSPILLQPVHNIFILWIVSTGLFGGVVLIYFLRNVFLSLVKAIQSKSLNKNFYIVTCLLVLSILASGSFDHYFLTLQQGQILTAVIIGFSFSDLKG